MNADDVNQIAQAIVEHLEKLPPAPDISGLHTLAGGLVTICIAYLALPNYRYRDQIEGKSETALKGLDANNASQNHGCKSHCAKLTRLAGSRATAEQKNHLDKNSALIRGDIVPIPGDWLFSPFFGSRFSKDMAIISLIATISTFILCAGAAKQAHLSDFGQTSSLSVFGKYWFINFDFWFMILSMIFPLFFIAVGGSRLKKADECIETYIKNCAEQIRGEELRREAPTVSPVDVAKRPPKAPPGEG